MFNNCLIIKMYRIIKVDNNLSSIFVQLVSHELENMIKKRLLKSKNVFSFTAFMSQVYFSCYHRYNQIHTMVTLYWSRVIDLRCVFSFYYTLQGVYYDWIMYIKSDFAQKSHFFCNIFKTEKPFNLNTMTPLQTQ